MRACISANGLIHLPTAIGVESANESRNRGSAIKSAVHDKVFIVTGASSGIGRSLAAELARRGAQTIAMARTTAKLDQLRAECGDHIHPFTGDVTMAEDCRRVVNETYQTFNRLDGLIHNAGISMRAIAIDSDPGVFRRLMEVNFFSMIHLFHACVAHLQESKGHLVAISSVMGRYSSQQRSGYCASKHALQGFMNSVRLELMATGVHTMVVSPGFVKTDVSRNALRADGKPLDKDSANILAGLDPDRVAKGIIDAMQRRKRDYYPAGTRERLGLFLSKWAPGLLDRILLKSDVS